MTAGDAKRSRCSAAPFRRAGLRRGRAGPRRAETRRARTGAPGLRPGPNRAVSPVNHAFGRKPEQTREQGLSLVRLRQIACVGQIGSAQRATDRSRMAEPATHGHSGARAGPQRGQSGARAGPEWDQSGRGNPRLPERDRNIRTAEFRVTSYQLEQGPCYTG